MTVEKNIWSIIGTGGMAARLASLASAAIPILMALASCASEPASLTTEEAGERGAASTMSLSSVTRTADAVSPKAVFIFWRISDYDADMTADERPAPYCVAKPSGEIDDYAVTKYSTGYNYPPNNEPVWATGYSPVCLREEQAAYSTITLPPDSVGLIDVLVAEDVVRGSALKPFEKPLTFVHAQTKLVFNAIKDSKVAGTLFVRNVHVTVGSSYLPYRMEFVDQKCYAFNSDECPDLTGRTIGPGNTTNQLTDREDDKRVVDSIYVRPGLKQIELTVTADIDNTSAMDNPRTATATTVVPFVDEEGNPLTLERGNRYTIDIVFSENRIQLNGYKTEWENGGNILLPVYPYNDKEETTGEQQGAST